ncbi:MAG: threonine/serine exporter family protein [Candidatus Fournierella pullistercoris]|uniref:Threonine/serine exporter family protein n=1 Tax=Candidatus Allofournierella pullistercoris TaxID=2838597 RepID=A0A948T2X0_9FIRM|nr:threonine/serine exporter family protein [Candidatus Fournierella pullistercoris]
MTLWQLAYELVTAFVGTVCFALLFHVAPRHYLYCGLVGTCGWLVYCLMMAVEPSPVLASLVAVIPLTILTRVLAIVRKAPVTLFLIPGIFPLVPGAGIYYTAYAFIMGDTATCAAKGAETLKIAVALAMGIALVVSFPLPAKIRVQKVNPSN